MKRIIFAMLLALVGVAATWAESYPLKIGGVQVTSDNYQNITEAGGFEAVKSGAGTVTYDPETNTLTLANAVIDATDMTGRIIGIAFSSTNNKTLVLAEGTTNAVTTQYASLYVSWGALTIEGGGTGIFSSSVDVAIYPSGNYQSDTLTIRDCSVTATASRGAIMGSGGKAPLVIDNATVRATGDQGSITYFSSLILTDAEITSPEGAVWKETAHAICMVGTDTPITEEVVIEPIFKRITVNDSTVTNLDAPIYGGYLKDGYFHSQFIIKADDLAPMTYANIDAMTFYATTNYDISEATFSVYMSEVEQTAFENSNLLEWHGRPTVYSGSLTIVDGKMVVNFDTPYRYMGGNLLIGFRQTGASSQDYNSPKWLGVTTDHIASVGQIKNNYVFQQSFLPKTTFYYTQLAEPPTGITIDPGYNTAVISWNGSSDSYKVRYRPMERVFSEDFESGSLDGWTVVRNGEGDDVTDWKPVRVRGSVLSYFTSAYSGDWVAWSRSNYYNGAEQEDRSFHVDNWLISPQIPLDGILTYWVRDNGSEHEHYDIYVSTQTTDVADFVKVYEPGDPWGAWVKHTVDLSAYGGALGYIAFRHNDYDKSFLLLDKIAVDHYTGEWHEINTPYKSVGINGLENLTAFELQIVGIKDGFPDEPSEVVSFYTLPDLFFDRKLDMRDVAILANIVVGKRDANNYPRAEIDTNKDGHISVADITAVINFIKKY